MGTTELRGVFHVLPTPFDEDERVDVAGLERLVQWILERGVHGITVLGIAGEVYRLTDSERALVTRVVIDGVNGRIPVVVGASHPGSTAGTIAYARQAEASGAAAVMIAPPFIARPADWQTVAFYESIAREVTLPVVVQDEPNTTGLLLPPLTLARIADAAAVCRYAKIEHAPTAPKFNEVRKLVGDNRLGMFGGSGGLYFISELREGARGIMTGFAFPEALLDMWNLFFERGESVAFDTFTQWLPLLQFESLPGVGLAIRKEILRRRGALTSTRLRSPSSAIHPSLLTDLERLLTRAEDYGQQATVPRSV